MMTAVVDPGRKSVRKQTQSLKRLARLIRQFLDLTRSIQQTYFTKRSRFDPVDELKFERDWKAFYGQAAYLQKRLEQTVAELHHGDPTINDFAQLLKKQNAHYQNWFKRLSRASAFAKTGALLEELMPHTRPVPTLHPKLCCTAPVLAALATLLEKEINK